MKEVLRLDWQTGGGCIAQGFLNDLKWILRGRPDAERHLKKGLMSCFDLDIRVETCGSVAQHCLSLFHPGEDTLHLRHRRRDVNLEANTFEYLSFLLVFDD